MKLRGRVVLKTLKYGKL
uniref:Uncharacterized protein n=1 Tax=Anguilla anguilla TaxID=7936 RepID=A0A0E9VP17_ANGAN